MNFIFDIILAGVMAFIVIRSWKKGFVATLLHLASIVISAIAAWVLHPALAQWIDNKFMSNPVTTAIRNQISSLSENGDLETMFSEMPQKFKNYLENLNVDYGNIQERFAAANQSAAKFADEVAAEIGAGLSYALSCAVALILIFTVSMIACTVVSFVINSVFKLPVLNSANKLMGIALGVVCAVFFAWVFSNGAVMFFEGMKAIAPYTFNDESIKSSVLINFFYNFNPYTLLNS